MLLFLGTLCLIVAAQLLEWITIKKKRKKEKKKNKQWNIWSLLAVVFLIKFWFLKIQILQEKIMSFATFRKEAYILLKILIFTLKIVNCIGTFEGKCQKMLYLIHSINSQIKSFWFQKKRLQPHLWHNHVS